MVNMDICVTSCYYWVHSKHFHNGNMITNSGLLLPELDQVLAGKCLAFYVVRKQDAELMWQGLNHN